ncbi:flagellar hook-basal body protein [Paenibacillus sp. MSJ-34]|uniref:flagellar hook-basal body protein n=1 Tax=Paenibacillus sp. MSJ-34 TaxID=2841529 RepID=UPI001C0F8FFB|nr:flagellar hook-basal body protein [Paenibacillus sp. MSJ-34]MBU5440948.1 flagellar hook-basal body protein [Paenibacillus sp. MSJ-34]
MNNSMISAMVSMGGIQKKLDIIADNIANMDTNGYKRKQSTFEDVLTTAVQHEEAMKLPGRMTPSGFTAGWGARLNTMSWDLSQGAMLNTGNPTDLAIEGDALFEVNADGLTGWTRGGALQLNPVEGDEENVYLTTSQGYLIVDTEDQPIAVPNGYHIQVDEKGNVTAQQPGSTESEEIARMKLVQPRRPDLLTQTDDNLFVIAGNTDPTVVLAAIDMDEPLDEQKSVAVRQGFLEQSNVSLTDEIADMMQVQRAYQLTARALTSSDNMMGLVNTLRA